MSEGPALTALAMRSKAHWGYDAHFIEDCRPVLTVPHDALADRRILVAERGGRPLGFIGFGRPEEPPEVTFLFVDPPAIGRGVGRTLWDAGRALARRRGWAALMVAADPDAAPFYRRVGCAPVGEVASEVRPDRRLPLLRYTLDPPPDAPTIGPARPDELARLAALEIRAGQRFRAVGMPAIADAPPRAVAEFEEALAHGAIFVARAAGEPVGFAMVEPIDAGLHLEELSVDPPWGGQGLGTRLLERVAQHARAIGAAAVTLTTFADVPWNGPYYRRRGFAVVPEADCTAALRARVRLEAAAGLDRALRVVMRRPIG